MTKRAFKRDEKKEVKYPCVCVGCSSVNRSRSTYANGEKEPRGGAETTGSIWCLGSQ